MGYPLFMMKSMENTGILMYDLGCLLTKVVQVGVNFDTLCTNCGNWSKQPLQLCILENSPILRIIEATPMFWIITILSNVFKWLLCIAEAEYCLASHIRHTHFPCLWTQDGLSDKVQPKVRGGCWPIWWWRNRAVVELSWKIRLDYQGDDTWTQRRSTRRGTAVLRFQAHSKIE